MRKHGQIMDKLGIAGVWARLQRSYEQRAAGSGHE